MDSKYKVNNRELERRHRIDALMIAVGYLILLGILVGLMIGHHPELASFLKGLGGQK